MIIWHMDGLVKVVKADAKPFVVTSNATNALFYIEYMGLVTFFSRDNKCHHTSYSMT